MEGEEGEGEGEDAGGHRRGHRRAPEPHRQPGAQRLSGELPHLLPLGGPVLLLLLLRRRRAAEQSRGGRAPPRPHPGELPEEGPSSDGEGFAGVQPPQDGLQRQRQGEPPTQQQGQGKEELRAQRAQGERADREEEAEGKEEVYRCCQHTFKRGESAKPFINKQTNKQK